MTNSFVSNTNSNCFWNKYKLKAMQQMKLYNTFKELTHHEVWKKFLQLKEVTK